MFLDLLGVTSLFNSLGEGCQGVLYVGAEPLTTILSGGWITEELAVVRSVDGEMHDGVKVLPEVTNWHMYLRSVLRKTDRVTNLVLNIVDDDMLVGDPNRRIDSSTLCSKLATLLQNLPQNSKTTVPQNILEFLRDLDENISIDVADTASLEKLVENCGLNLGSIGSKQTHLIKKYEWAISEADLTEAALAAPKYTFFTLHTQTHKCNWMGYLPSLRDIKEYMYKAKKEEKPIILEKGFISIAATSTRPRMPIGNYILFLINSYKGYTDLNLD